MGDKWHRCLYKGEAHTLCDCAIQRDHTHDEYQEYEYGE